MSPISISFATAALLLFGYVPEGTFAKNLRSDLSTSAEDILEAASEETFWMNHRLTAMSMLDVKAAESSSAVPLTFDHKKPPDGTNPCEGKKPDLPNVACVIDQVEQTGEQSATNVTEGYKGERNTTAVPILVPYYQVGLCPVNAHSHLGSEHYSLGEYDENGKGPSDIHERRRLSGKVRQGFQCHHYDENDPKFTTAYDWQYCKNYEVGQTYEVHWPHSAAGDCGTPNQYQSPFYDGVFCKDIITDTASQIGVQSQVFTLVNDESYYWPDLFRGMIVDGEMGQDVAKYTGSTTGESRNDTVCSDFSPITWQVDRKCHLISASSFDKMCADMLAQRDDMSEDLEPHGSRELVDDEHAANNHQGLRELLSI